MTSPTWKPSKCAAAAVITTSSRRSGSAKRPAVTASRSWSKNSPSTLATGWMSLMAARRGAPFRASGAAAIGMAASTCRTPGRRAIASTADDEYDRRAPAAVADPSEDGDTEVRRVGAGQVGSKRRLGTPGRGQRPHRQATHQADEDNQGEVATLAMAESGPIAIPRHAQALPSQGHASPLSCMPCAPRPWPAYPFHCKCAAAQSQDQGGQPLDPPSYQHHVMGSQDAQRQGRSTGVTTSAR